MQSQIVISISCLVLISSKTYNIWTKMKLSKSLPGFARSCLSLICTRFWHNIQSYLICSGKPQRLNHWFQLIFTSYNWKKFLKTKTPYFEASYQNGFLGNWVRMFCPHGLNFSYAHSASFCCVVPLQTFIGSFIYLFSHERYQYVGPVNVEMFMYWS